MAIAKFFLVALLFATAVLAQTETKRVIDEFTVGQDTFVIVTIGDGSTQSQSGTVTATGGDVGTIIGAERDSTLQIDGVLSDNVVYSLSVSNGQLTEAAPSIAQQGNLGFVDIQWDGPDADPANVDGTGLGSVDFNANLADRFHISGRGDFEFQAQLVVYSGSSTCSALFTVPDTAQPADIFLDFQDFSGPCDFSNVGAVQLFVDITDNLDLTLDFIRTAGPIPATPTPTTTPTPTPSSNPSASNTPTPAPSASNTPTPAPSASNTPAPTPTQTPTPSPIIDDDECYCVCPAFRCELFRSDDEDAGIVGYRSVSDEYWNWYGFPTSVIYDFFSTYVN